MSKDHGKIALRPLLSGKDGKESRKRPLIKIRI